MLQTSIIMFRFFSVFLFAVLLNFVARAQSSQNEAGKESGLVPLRSQSNYVKQNNIVYNDSLRLVSLPVKPGTSLTAFDPAFVSEAGMKIYPAGKTDFSKVRWSILSPGRVKPSGIELKYI